MKVIALMPVKNEEWILEKTLAPLSKICDHIMVADQNSTDRSIEIVRSIPNCILSKNDEVYHSSNVRKMLLDAARESFSGSNLLISLDADEIFTSNILDKDIMESWKALPKGTSISLVWNQLWRSIHLYRNDDSVWTNNRKYFVYIDDKSRAFDNVNVINDHTGRFPFDPRKIYVENRVSVLHFQFVCYERMLSKQNYYMVSEKVFGDETDKCINEKYKIAKDEENISFQRVDKKFYSGWEELGMSFDIRINEYLFWYDLEVLSMMKKYGCRFFKNLNIWDIDWKLKKQMALAKGHTEFTGLSIRQESRDILFSAIKRRFVR